MSSSEQNSLKGKSMAGARKQTGKETKRSQIWGITRLGDHLRKGQPNTSYLCDEESHTSTKSPFDRGISAKCWESVSITNSKTAGSEVSNYWEEAFEGDEETGEDFITVRNKRNLVGNDLQKDQRLFKIYQKEAELLKSKLIESTHPFM